VKDELFRLSCGLEHDPEIDAWFDARPDELGFLAKFWFDQMRFAGNDVLDLVHDGYPVACIDDAAFGYVNVFTSHLNVGFFAGAFLPDPARLLQGTGKRMRHVKVSPVVAYDRDALMELIVVAYSDMNERVRRST
jgi:hypothetical protein